MGGQIILNADVKKINVNNKNVTSIEYIEKNHINSVNTDYLISSMPIKDLVL